MRAPTFRWSTGALIALLAGCGGGGGGASAGASAHPPVGDGPIRLDCRADGSGGAGQAQALHLSGDGRYAVFTTSAEDLGYVGAVPFDHAFGKDVWTGRLFQYGALAPADTPTWGYAVPYVSISEDGRFVAFETDASLVAADGLSTFDVYLLDRVTHELTWVTRPPAPGKQGGGAVPRISGDGSRVVFISAIFGRDPFEDAPPLAYVYDRRTRATTCCSLQADGSPSRVEVLWPEIDRAGDRVTFFAWHPISGLIGPDPSNLYVRDLAAATTTCIHIAPGVATVVSSGAAISGDGRRVAFVCEADDGRNPGGHAQVWLHDLASGTTDLVSVTPAGVAGVSDCMQPALDATGRRVAFASFSWDLVPGETNDVWDVFVRDMDLGRTIRVSCDPQTGGEATQSCLDSAISADGSLVGFSQWTDEHRPDGGGVSHVYAMPLPPFGDG
jgi:hypothetical protein